MRTLILKKITKILLSCVMAGALFTGCDNNIKGNVTKIGTIKYINVTEDALAKANVSTYGNKKCEYIFFDNMNSMAAALNAGQIDEMSTYKSVAEYIDIRNPNADWTTIEPELTDWFCCAMREENADLKKEFDEAILQMTTDGTLASLVKSYIGEFTHADTPPVITLPTFYDKAPVIKIGVTGDLPMLDYIRPDGVPAGFNTAVLAEISKRIEKNFVLIQVDSGARATALMSSTVDVIFWAIVPSGNSNLPADIDKIDGMILTVPYFSDKIVHVKIEE